MMMYINNWVLTFKYSLKRLIKNILSVFAKAFSIAGILFTVAEVADKVFEYHGLFKVYKDNYWIILIILFIISIYKHWDSLIFKIYIAGSSDVSITLKVGDALSNEGAIIIPTNTTFDTCMKDDFISKSSVQGQYQIKFFKDNLEKLDELINDGLKGRTSSQIKDGRNTKLEKYPIGEVSKVTWSKKRAYFLADSNINERGIPQDVTISDLTDALVALWETLNILGNMETYSIPLLGTGKAGVKDASRDDVVKLIALTFLAATKEHKITENLIICIHPLDFEKIHWDDLCEFLKYHCQFVNSRPIQNNKSGEIEVTPKVVALKR
ncbi:MAG: hypothetical protein IK129_03825 [Deltaproteobacteria bacterium]|nr:hypothetical protein [Deltaproteobacteria bacterium]